MTATIVEFPPNPLQTDQRHESAAVFLNARRTAADKASWIVSELENIAERTRNEQPKLTLCASKSPSDTANTVKEAAQHMEHAYYWEIMILLSRLYDAEH